MLFDQYELDIGTFELRRDGVAVSVEPQVFDLLVCLAQNSGKLVSRDELINSVWKGRIVSDATVDARIAAARRAIDDDGKRQRFIKTVPRRGLLVGGDAGVGPAEAGAKVERRSELHPLVQACR